MIQTYSDIESYELLQFIETLINMNNRDLERLKKPTQDKIYQILDRNFFIAFNCLSISNYSEIGKLTDKYNNYRYDTVGRIMGEVV